MTNNSKKFSAFDLDHTLLKENSSYAFGKYLYQKKHISFSAFFFIIRTNIFYKLGFLSIKDLHERAFKRLFCGKSLFEVQSWVTDFLDTHFESLFYPPAIQALNAAKQAEHLTAIMSSSPSFLVEPIADRFNISLCYATQYGVDQENRFSNIKHLMLGEDKANLMSQVMIKHQISKMHSIAYSDSILDLPFLLSAGKAIAVNPDKKLRRFCVKNNWSII